MQNISSATQLSSRQNSEESAWRIPLYELARLCAGTVLLVASVLRVYTWPAALVDGGRPLNVLLSLGEAALGAILICGFCKVAVRWIAIACFAAFLALVTVRLLRGEVDCHCFGGFRVPPVLTFWLDAGLFIALFVGIPSAALRPVDRKPASRAVPVRRALVFLLLVSSPAVILLLSAMRPPARLANNGTISSGSPEVLLEPQSWLAQRWPLLPHVGERGRLSHGAWLVVLYREDCSACQEALTRVNGEYAVAGSPSRSAIRTSTTSSLVTNPSGNVAILSPQPALAMVEVPGDAGAVRGATPHSVLASFSLKTRLGADHQWILPTPTLIWLRDGIVVQVGQEQTLPATSAPVRHRVVTASATDPQDASNGGNIVFDLGFVPVHQRTSVMLSVPSLTSKSMSLRAVRADCACMSIPFPPAELAAGHPTLMELRFDAPEGAQPYAKRIVMVPADPQAPAIHLVVRARVGLPLTVNPRRWSVPTTEDPASGSTLEVTVANAGDEPCRILYGTSELPDCIVTVPQNHIAGGAAMKLSIRLGPEARTKLLAAQRAIIHLHADCPTQPEVDIIVDSAVRD